MVIPIIMVVERALRDAGIPIEGVSIGTPADRSTWRAFYAAGATPGQIVQGDALIQSVDPQDPTIVAELKQDFAANASGMDLILALGQATYELSQSPASFPTLASFRNRVRTLYLNRL